MELHCFDQDSSVLVNSPKTKYIYNPKEKWLISYYFERSNKLFKSTISNIDSSPLPVHTMDDLILGDQKENSILKYLGKIDFPEREVKNTLAAAKYLEMYKQKAKKLPELYKNKEEKMTSVFNSKVKSLVDLIENKSEKSYGITEIFPESHIDECLRKSLEKN